MRYAFLLAALVLVSGASAQPVLTSVSADTAVVHGNTLTITGTGFGAKDQAAPMAWDDFQEGTPAEPGEAGAGNWITRENSIWNGISASVTRQPYWSSGRQRVDGDICALLDYPGQYPESNKGVRYSTDAGQGHRAWYVSFWCYQDDWMDTALNCENAKVYGNYSSSRWVPSNGHEGINFRWDEYWSGPGGHMFGYTCDVGRQEVTGVYHNNLDKWTRVERWLDMGNIDVANGYHAGSQDLQIRGAWSGQLRFSSCGDDTVYAESCVIGHFFNRQNGAAMRLYISELYMDNSFARVELGNAPTWAACTHREIQIPSAWSATEITVTVNQGAFEAEDDVWLYVVDENRVNNSVGYPLVIGGEPASEPEQVGIPGPVIFDGEEASVSWTAPVDLGVPAYYGVYLVKDGVERRVGSTPATYMDRIPAENGMGLYVVAHNALGQVFSRSETVEVVEWR